MKLLFRIGILSVLALICTLRAGAQGGTPPDMVGVSNINVVIMVLATIFAGIILFLIYLERKLKRLEKRAGL